MFVATIGFIMVIAIVALLLKGKMSPIVVLITVPTIAALIMGYSVGEVGGFIKEGVGTTTSNAILFLFSVVFFGVMSDVGVFDIIVNFLVKKAGANVVSITVATAIIAIIAHLDGSTATTVLISIPSMWPIYKRMKIRPHVLLCIVASAMGVMNLLPWGGPTARTATVLGMDATILWHMLIPIQVLGCIVTILLAVVLGILEKRRGAGLVGDAGDCDVAEAAAAQVQQGQELKRSGLLWFNILLTVGLIASLMLNITTSYVLFMLFLSAALIINFPSLKEQDNRIKAHAPTALIISATMLASGAMVGIMNGTNMLDAMANAIISVLPDALGRYIHIIFGVLGMPLGMVVGTDAYFYGIMPLIIEVGTKYGIAGLNTAMAMIIGKNVVLMISPLVPATYLAIGLVDMDLKDHIRFCFKWLFAVTMIMLLGGLLMGIIKL
ncbi:citrate:H+ symporter [Lacrimispora amygdalina]|uniref:Citrate:H+ symporter n=1 Tax=Lacrimispora amygdalina TaxID=253257 RepID=A0A3E2NAK8_9FIRM|nr:citrate:proton symporter [Clostridium indicum]RFZ78047.1 citrate:H+ symporter [Clostridium indicum]